MSKVFIEESTLTAIGDAIRSKDGSTALIAPLDMAAAITNLPTGGGGDLPEEALLITGTGQYRFANGNWDWFINTYGNRVTTKDITSADHMFFEMVSVEEIPFTLNFAADRNIIMSQAFARTINAHPLRKLPAITNCRVSELTSLCQSAARLEEIPDEFVNGIDWSYIESLTSAYSGRAASMFQGCNSLRKVPDVLLKRGNPTVSNTNSVYYNAFNNCYCLDEVHYGLFYTASWTANAFASTFNNCYRLKSVTFDLQEDGTPYVKPWKNQTIDLSTAGYVPHSTYTLDNVLNYGAATGITADKKITDDASYQALKDDPNCLSCGSDGISYSRYNHDSAVETINTLPDCSATGTNTIKFTGAAGTNTDGGAINTLTEEEIAVATAKGWTVTLV